MYCNGMGFRQIERCTDVCHNTVINWVKKSAKALPKQPTIEAIPEVGELDELQTFVGKKNLIWLWTVVNHFKEGILGWIIKAVRHLPYCGQELKDGDVILG